MSKTATISKWGNCLAVRIPQYIVDNLELKAGDSADLSYRDSRIVIELHKREKPTKVKTEAELFEEEMLRQLREKGVPGFE